MRSYIGHLTINFKIAHILLIFVIIAPSFFGCKKKKESERTEQTPKVVSYGSVQQTAFEIQDVVPYEVAQDKSLLNSYYENPDLKEWYKERLTPPPFDYAVDLSKKSYREVRLLRQELYARNGYLFMEASLRGYFNQFKWYQPVFDVPGYKLQLDSSEDVFVKKALQREGELAKERYVAVGVDTLINMDQVQNLDQFKQIDTAVYRALQTRNFVLARAAHDQLFQVYDQNQYQYIPDFITTDLYLQVLHIYLSGLMKKIEEESMVPLVTELLTGLDRQALDMKTTNPKVQSALKWAQTYLAVALTSMTNETASVDPSMKKMFDDEISKVRDAQGIGSDFLQRGLFNYSQFKPRGNYTKTDRLKRYFRCVKWLSSAPFLVSDDDQLGAAVLISWFVVHGPSARRGFSTMNSVVQLLAGEEDNLSLSHLIRIVAGYSVGAVDKLFTPQVFDGIRSKLAALDVSRINPAAGNDIAKAEFAEKTVLFTAGRYNFDGEIFSRMIHVLRPDPKRPFPKGLDIFAVLGDEKAKSILLDTYKEAEKWPGYPDSLKVLTRQFASYGDWNSSIYNKTMESVRSLNSDILPQYPLFMRTSEWQKKNLQTSLAAWAELKHDMILYSEQPFAAEAGEAGGPPPPRHIGYVEPNIAFWKNALALLDYQESKLAELKLLSPHLAEIGLKLKAVGEFLLAMSEKEVKRENVSDGEFDRMTWIGGEIERITLDILESDHLPERERQIAVVADVYTYNRKVLEEAVGLGDEIYVIVEINGLPYLAKGTCFSYYEFESDIRLTDEEWQEMLGARRAPEKPEWVQEIYAETNSLLESKPEYSF
jgi:hypothetical protein